MQLATITERLPFERATAAAALDAAEVVSAVMPLIVGTSTRRITLAIDWLFQTYVAGWVAEACLPGQGFDLDASEQAAQAAWALARGRVKASVAPGAWSSVRETVRDTVTETMRASLEAAIRLPVETVEWSRWERKAWSTVEACLWTIAWRAVLDGADDIRGRIEAALEPRKQALQRSAVALIERIAAVPVTPSTSPYDVDGVLFNYTDHVLAFMRQHLPHVTDFGHCNALGIVRNGRLIGGVVFNNFYPAIGDVEVSAAFTTSAWFRTRTLRRLFAFPFVDLGCHRLTHSAAASNLLSRRLAERAGFRFEGLKRRGFDGAEDVIQYGMLREECRFLPKDA